MGTNFYVITRGTKTCECCGHIDHDARFETHLGKRSGGWKFLYRAQPEWTREDAYRQWCTLLATGEIADEYGQMYSTDEMMNLANEWDMQAKVHMMYDGQYEDAHGHRFDTSDFC